MSTLVDFVSRRKLISPLSRELLARTGVDLDLLLSLLLAVTVCVLFLRGIFR